MEVCALVGSSGTGKSHRAVIVASNLDADAIIDDGLLIQNNRIIAGTSAKRQPTKLGAIKAALFMDDAKAEEIIQCLEETQPTRILLLGTSDGMVRRIAQRLRIPSPTKIVRIEEVASEKEIRKARYHRNRYSKHVIPAPALEVKRSLPGILVDPLHIFLRKKEHSGKKDWIEKSVIRPTRTYNGRLIITDSAISAIVSLAAKEINGISAIDRVKITLPDNGAMVIDVSPTITYGSPLHTVAADLQKHIRQTVEMMTGLTIAEVNVRIKGLAF